MFPKLFDTQSPDLTDFVNQLHSFDLPLNKYLKTYLKDGLAENELLLAIKDPKQQVVGIAVFLNDSLIKTSTSGPFLQIIYLKNSAKIHDLDLQMIALLEQQPPIKQLPKVKLLTTEPSRYERLGYQVVQETDTNLFLLEKNKTSQI